MMLSDVCLSVAYIGPRKTKIGTDVAHVTRDSDTTSKVKGQGHQAALVGFTGRRTWTYSNGDLSICVHNVYRVTTCRPGRGDIVAAARLQLVFIVRQQSAILRTSSVCMSARPSVRLFNAGIVSKLMDILSHF